MSEQPEQEAPALGAPTDAALGDNTAAFLLSGGRLEPVSADAEQTMDTPDDLGGTGGGQAGGAG